MHFYDNHLREAEKIFVCEYCQMRFALRTMLNKHVKLAHEKKHICDYCGNNHFNFNSSFYCIPFIIHFILAQCMYLLHAFNTYRVPLRSQIWS